MVSYIFSTPGERLLPLARLMISLFPGRGGLFVSSPPEKIVLFVPSA
jgi:hypothetical protein